VEGWVCAMRCLNRFFSGFTGWENAMFVKGTA
jgi:hypothetical protein